MERVHTWGEPPWRVSVGLPPAPLPKRVDVAVVGAGLTGLAAAYHLAARGLRVAVLEAGHLGAGASGRTGGIVLEETAAGPLEGAKACIPSLERLREATGIECDLRLMGCYELRHETGEAPPAGPLAWRDGESWLCVDGVVPGGTLDPGALLGGLARAACAAGATLHIGTPVRALRPGQSAPVALVHGALACDAVVLAAGSFVEELLPPIEHFRAAFALALVLGPVSREVHAALGLADGRPFYTADHPYLWGRPLRDDRLVFGAGLVAAPEAPLRSLDVRSGAAAQALADLEVRVRRLHPALAGAVVAQRWGGPVSFRGGAAPLLARHPRDARCVVASAYAGHGVALALRAGELIARAVADDAPLPAWGAFHLGTVG